MTNRIAVAVIHGMGRQGDEKPEPNELSFSAGLYMKLKNTMGIDNFHNHLVWKEIFWSDILEKRQNSYVDSALVGKARWMKERRFVMHNLADAAAYRLVPDESSDIYRRIHERVASGIRWLEKSTGGNCPLIILAHSLGGHIISNYVYDMQKAISKNEDRPKVLEDFGQPGPLSAFQRLETMAGFVTFGCNIPIFTFAYPKSKVYPIARPGTLIPGPKRLKPWWLNYNDKDDVLGMPLREINHRYAALASSNQLRERWIDVGNLLTFWNPAAHIGYWKDEDFYEPVARFLHKALKIGPVGAPLVG